MCAKCLPDSRKVNCNLPTMTSTEPTLVSSPRTFIVELYGCTESASALCGSVSATTMHMVLSALSMQWQRHLQVEASAERNMDTLNLTCVEYG